MILVCFYIFTIWVGDGKFFHGKVSDVAKKVGNIGITILQKVLVTYINSYIFWAHNENLTWK